MSSVADTMATRALSPVGDAELERRWAALRTVMAAAGLDAVLTQATNDWLVGTVKWLTDLPATNGYPRTVLFFTASSMVVVEMGPFGQRRVLDGTDALHRGVAEVLGTPSFLNVGYINGWDATLATSALRARGCRRVGIVGPGGLLHALVSTLQAEFDCADATDLVDGIKAVKSAAEQVGIRAMAALQDDVFAAVLGAIRPGMRDVDVTALAQHTAQTLVSEQGIFIGSSARLGLASMFLPRHLQGRTIRAGDHFSLLIEVNGLGGFYGEIARTIVLGRASAELLDGFAAVREAQTHTLSLIRPGAVPAEIAAAHDAWMVARGLPPETRLYAHGQGYDMVERPLLRRDETLPIAEGMLLAIHPGYETPSLFAVICDNYLVTATGASDCLHRTEKKVFELNV